MTPLLQTLLRSHIDAETGAEHILIVSADEHHAVIATVEDDGVQRQYRVFVDGDALSIDQIDCTTCASCGNPPGTDCMWTPPERDIGWRGGIEGDCPSCVAMVERMQGEPTSSQIADYCERYGVPR
jgi:hypothetical protein